MLGFGEFFQSSEKKVSDLTHKTDLIGQLKSEHVQIKELLQEALVAASGADVINTHQRLHDFKTALQLHIAEENVKFYGYIQAYYSTDKEMVQRIRSARMDMNQIVAKILRFVRRYESIEDFEGVKWADFSDELVEIGICLGERIELEENKLYPLYRD